MSRFWTRAWLCGALLGLLAMPAVADDGNDGDLRKEIESLRELVESQADRIAGQKAEIESLRVDDELVSSAVERAVDDALSLRAAEGDGSGGFMDGHFKLSDGGGDASMEIGGRIHVDLYLHEKDTPGQSNRFNLRRVRLYFKGTIAEVWGYKVQYDFAANSLRDAYIQVALGDLLGVDQEGISSITMTAGQKKVGFSRSELTSSNTINTIARPIIVRSLAPGYDVGLFFNNTYMDGKLSWWTSITNGWDVSDDEMAYASRVVFNPFMGEEDNMLETLSVGFNCYYENRGSHSGSSSSTSTGWTSTSTGGTYGYEHQTGSSNSLTATGTARGLDLRVGLDAHWHYGQFGFTTEGIVARQGQRRTTASFENGTRTVSDELEMWGAYCQLNYMISGGDWSEDPDNGLEAVLQLEWVALDHGGTSSEQDLWACTLGISYYFNANARFMLNWVATDTGDDVRTPERDGSRYKGGGGLDHNVSARLQLVF